MANTPLQNQLALRQSSNPIQTGLSDISQYGNMAKGLTHLAGSGSTLGGLFGPGLGQAGGSLMGNVLPGAGAVLGIWNMIQNKGNLSNILSGAGSGASIGTMVMPGIGTLAGAGIGALAGGVEDLFNIGKPSQTELQGRDVNNSLQQYLSSQATPQQIQEAQKAVASGAWKDTSGPLQIITTRDALIKQGIDPTQADQQAQQIVKDTWNAEKQGGQAVQQAYMNPISQILNNRSQGSTNSPSQSGTGFSPTQGLPWGQALGSTSRLPYQTDAFSAGANRG